MANNAAPEVMQANSKTVKSENESSEKEQEVLKAAVDSMVEAFNTFHAEIENLRHEQQDVIKHINERLDKRKIQQIKETLKNSSQE